MKKRQFINGVAAAAMLMTAGVAAASETITIVVPFAAGSSADGVARLFAKQVNKSTGQTVIVDNRAGANGVTAASYVKRTVPDGRTLLLSNVGTDAINASLYPKLPYDSQKDFAPISLLWTFPSVLAVPSKSLDKTVAELVKRAKSNPDGVFYGSAGAGSGGHLLAEMLRLETNAPMKHVPYKGMAPALTDLLGARLDFIFSSYGAVYKMVESGNLRLLAVASDKRLKALPQLPTLKEEGIGDSIMLDNWFGISAPSGTPKDTVQQLQKVFEAASKDAELIRHLQEQGIEAVGSTSDAYARVIRDDSKRLGSLVKSLGLSAN